MGGPKEVSLSAVRTKELYWRTALLCDVL